MLIILDTQIGILHLSDIHASKMTEEKLEKLVELLKQDLITLVSSNNIKIELICISGDLINSGDNSVDELEIVLNKVIRPLVETFNLSNESVFIVPGNHEIKRSEVVDYIENGLALTLSTEDSIEEFLNNLDAQSLKRISYFEDFSLRFSGEPTLNKNLVKSYIVHINDVKLGIVCINSAWRSTGIGEMEKGKMVVGRKLIIDGYESVETADIKICIMHHPLDWLVGADKNAIEKCINKFDIILNGHIHETSTKIYTSYNGQAIYNTCGKFDNSSDIYNGYSLISINPYNKDCRIHLRKYFDFPRNCFDKAIELQKDGVFETCIGNKKDELALAYDIVHSIRENFLSYANSYFVSNVAFGKNVKSFDEAFILPTFSKYCEYEKETAYDIDKSEKTLTLEEICNGNKNVLLLGKKEIGKTTILHYIMKNYLSHFNTLHTLPILIDCATVDYSGKNVISRAAREFINKFCMDTDSFSQNQIEKLLEAGMCTVLFDNLEMVKHKELDKINEFISLYNRNKFVFSERETIGARSFRDVLVAPKCEYEEVHICSLTRKQIRSATKQYLVMENNAIDSSLVDKIEICFKNTTLPKTPFVLSLILSLCDNYDFTPINEATVMEQFMEFLFEKSSPEEADSRTYDFKIKEDFLMYIVSCMHSQNKYFLSNYEFDNLVSEYHIYRGFSIRDTRFDRIFFERGVLVSFDDKITFRYTCMIEYYIAKKAGQDIEFFNEIIENKNYLNYQKELLYYTGLNRNHSEVLKMLQNDLNYYFDIFNPIISGISDYEIGLDIAVPEDVLENQLPKTRFSQETSDLLTDFSDSSDELLPQKIDKNRDFTEMDSFIQTLLIYGDCLKNLELIALEEKERAYDIYSYGLCIMLRIMQSCTEEFFNENINDLDMNRQKYTEEDIMQMKNIVKDILMIALPIAIQNISLENIGTTKLHIAIESAIKNSSAEDFKKFFSVFLYADLRLPGLKDVLKKYIKEIKDKSLLKIIFIKLMYYYQLRYFNSDFDSFLENTLADVNFKLKGENKFVKGHFIKEIRKQERK